MNINSSIHHSWDEHALVRRRADNRRLACAIGSVALLIYVGAFWFQ